MRTPQKNHSVGAVSFLNTVPLIWGMLHGAEREHVDLRFSIPSECADQLEQNIIEIGLVPVAEIARQQLEMLPGVGIAALGAVRSILLFSRVPWTAVRTLAADISSRTSVQLAKIILRERFGVEPAIAAAKPNLAEMLEACDAALVIGDPALHIDPEAQPFAFLDLAAEWFDLTGLPFLFAAWAGKPGIPIEALHKLTTASYAFGRAHLADIIESEYSKRQITKDLADRYLRQHIRFEIGPKECEAMELFIGLMRGRRAMVGVRG